ncbi:MAG: diaminopimelate decarboxylase [Dehalococcoidales bacterium]
MTSRLSLFPLTAEVNSRGRLSVGGCDTVELAVEYGTPLYLFDEATIRRRCREFRAEFGRRYADTSVVYAGKAFLNRALVTVIKDEGLGLDVVSAGEMVIAESAGFPMDMVYFHGSNKSADELKLALKQHIGRIVIDNYDELGMLADAADECGRIPDVMLRLTPGVDPHTHEHITTGKVDSKFGFPLFYAAEAVARAMQAPSLHLVGFHFHLGSLIYEPKPYKEAIEVVLEFVADMVAKYGLELEELDIGGGFPVQYAEATPAPSVAVFAEAIISTLTGKCRQLKMTPPSLTIEPGRAIVAQAGVALYSVGVIKEIPGIRSYVSVDGGMADNIRPALYGARYEAVLANKMTEKEAGRVTIAGRYCESGDILVKDIDLPPVAAGDVIAVADCGAYCLPMASNYNASLRPAAVMVNEGKARLIRRRETFADLTRCDLV